MTHVQSARWTVDAESTRDIVSWPEEFDDFQAALLSEFHVENPVCDVDVAAGSLTARFQVDADRREAAELMARRVMTDALGRAGLQAQDERIAHLDVTPTRSAG